MNAFDATVSAYAEVGRDLWTDVKDCASLGLAFVSPEEVCLALPSERLGELCFPPVGMPDLPERCLFVWWAPGSRASWPGWPGSFPAEVLRMWPGNGFCAGRRCMFFPLINLPVLYHDERVFFIRRAVPADGQG